MSGGAATVGRLVVSVSGDVDQLSIDMKEAQAIVGGMTKDIVNSLQGITDATYARNTAGKSMLAAMQQELDTFGMGSDELKIYKATLAGVGDQMASMVERLNSMKAAQASFTDQVVASEAEATARIKAMVAASVSGAAAMNDSASAASGLAGAQARLGTVAGSVSEAVRIQNQNMAGTTAAMRAAAAGTGELSSQTQAILARYDPLGVKLRSLQSDLLVLRKEMGNSVDPAAMKAFQGLETEISKTQALMAKAGVEGFGAMEDGAKKGAFATAGATRELMVMGHEIISGNFSRMPGSFMVLAERMSMTSALLNPMTIGLVGLAAAGVAVAVALQQGHDQMVAMNNALAVTSGFAGMTASDMSRLAESMTQTRQVTIGAATDIVTALVNSGKIGGDAIGNITKFIANYAAVTNQSIDQVAPKLISMFEDPIKGAEELNSSMHFLTVTQLEHIASLERVGETQKAQDELAQAASAHMPQQAKNVGVVTAAINEQKDAWSKLWQAIKDAGADTSKNPAAEAQKVRDEISELMAKGYSRKSPEIQSWQKILDAMEPAIAKQKEMTQAEKDAAAANQLQAKSWDAVKASSTAYHIQELRDQLTLVEQLKPTNGTQAAAQQDSIRKINDEIIAAQRSIGQEGCQLTQQQITDQDQLALAKLKGAADDINNQLKLGNFTKEQFDIEMSRNALDVNAEKQKYELRMANVAGLTDAERQAHLDKLKLLQQEHDQIEANGAAQIDIDDKKAMDSYITALDKAGEASIKSLDAQIAKEQRHAETIGMTKSQVEALHAAQEAAAVAQLQSESEAIANLLLQNDLNADAKKIYTDLLSQINGQIAAHKELSQVLAANSAQDAQAEAAAASARLANQAIQDWKTAGAEIANSLSTAFGTGGKAIGTMFKAYADGAAAQLKAQKDIAAVKDSAASADVKAAAIQRAQLNGAEAQVKSYGDMAQAAQGFFDKGSTGYKAMAAASEVLRIAEVGLGLVKGVNAVLTQGEGDPYSAFGRMAAMAAIVAGLGVAIGGMGGSSQQSAADRQAAQGTGTVLGDTAAKSASIADAVKLSAANSSTQIDYLSNMLTALRGIETNISSFAAQLVQSTNISNPTISGLKAGAGTTTLAKADLTATGAEIGMYFGPIGAAVGAVVGLIASYVPAIQHAYTAVFGGKQSVSDSGFTLSPTSLGAIESGGLNARSYADITTSGGWFGSDKHSIQSTALGADANQQITAVIASLGDSIKQAGILLGMNGDDFTKQLNSFVVDIGSVSLKGLTGDQIQKELESVFSKLGDQMAQFAIGGLQQFAKVGEGYLETLTRVAADYAKVDASLQSIGMTFGSVGIASIGARENLISLMGGIDQFQSETAGFAQNFLSKAEQLAPVAKYVDQQLAALGLTGITTRDQFKQVVLGLDLATSAGQQEYAALMQLQSAFAATHAATVDLSKTEQDIANERKTLQDQFDQLVMSSTQLLQKQRDALDASNQALFDQIQVAQKVKDAQTAATSSLGTFLSQMQSFATTAAGLNSGLMTGSLSTLTPEQQYAQERQQFQQTSQGAMNGDATAQGQLSSVEQAYLTMSQKINGGDTQYQADMASVMQTNDQVATWAKGQVDTAQASLNALNDSSATLKDIAAILTAMGKGVPYDPAAITASSGDAGATTGRIVHARILNAAPTPDYSSMGASNTTALVSEIKALRTEVAGLRADSMKQTGDGIAATGASQQQAAQTIVSGVGGIVARAVTSNQKVVLE